MKINYTFANGETSDVEVSEEIGTMILDSRREENNLDRKERFTATLWMQRYMKVRSMQMTARRKRHCSCSLKTSISQRRRLLMLAQ